MIAFFGNMELWIVLAVALLLFGHRIPGMARSLGSGIVEFKRGLKGDEESDQLGSSGDASGSSAGTGTSSTRTGD